MASPCCTVRALGAARILAGLSSSSSGGSAAAAGHLTRRARFLAARFDLASGARNISTTRFVQAPYRTEALG